MQHNSSKTYKNGEVSGHSNSDKKQLIENYVCIPDRYVPPRAIAVLPELLQIRRNIVSPRRPLPSRVCFGPVQGVKKLISTLEAKDMINKSVETKTPLFLLKAEQNDFVVHIDNTDPDKSNWLSLLTLGDQMTANVWLYEEQNKLYALTTKSTPSRVPLTLGYSSEYVRFHGFPSESPCLDIEEALSSPACEWWCYECQRAMPSAALLQHHINIEHKFNKLHPHRRHRCQQCKRIFTRLFTLKRHMARHCAKKEVKLADATPDPTTMPPLIESELDTNSLLEENRIDPSVEILQNFTANIDFNVLFDTYRMVNLDLSDSCKSDVELTEPENQLCRVDSGLVSTPNSYDNTCTVVENNTCENSSNTAEEPSVKNCSSVACKKTKTQRNQQYASDISPEIFSCECGRAFLNKDKLIRHVMEHSNTKSVVNSDIMYKCEDCQLIFKRRGMFVNHLWRVHKNNTTSIPLERRVRYYPCVACPKVYRTAAKRDRHLAKHHPGTSSGQARAVESGRRTCAAAACPACPRQYATRAKLMQHVRAAHPIIAPPLKVNTSKNETLKIG